ncbi:hypothetical protein SDJN03_03364, partial [Cucurbita argyrosperma subsp. sororia]
MFKLNVLALCTQKESGTTLSLKRSCWIFYIPILPRVLVRNYVYTGAFDFPFIISGCFVCKCLGVRGMGIGLQNQRKWELLLLVYGGSSTSTLASILLLLPFDFQHTSEICLIINFR